MRKVSLLIAMLFFLTVVSVDASAESMLTSEPAMRYSYGASWLIGHGVRNEQGEDLGSVVDILFAENGRIEYVVLDQGGILGRGLLGRGVGDQLYAIPWKLADVSPAENRISLDLAKGKLLDAPTFARTEWEKFSDPEFESRVYGYYGLEQTIPAERYGVALTTDTHRATSMFDLPVQNAQGERLGTVEELIAGENNRIQYAIVSYGGFLGFGENLVAVPFHSLQLEPDQRAVRLDMDKTTFESAPHLGSRQWSALDDPDFAAKIREYFE
jgi:sporulation protein YlmC with PRC-barrel domain